MGANGENPVNRRGCVIRSTGSWYDIRLENGQIVSCRIKGVLKKDGVKTTNPIVVGDWVNVAHDDESTDFMITSWEARTNYISRESPRKAYSRHILAANMDQAVLIATLRLPRTSSGFIDRFLVSAEAFHIPTIIVFHKQDLLREKDEELQDYYHAVYELSGYEVLLTSMDNEASLKGLQQKLLHKTTLMAGHSGVGKSTIINFLAPSATQRTAAISKKHEKGLHTTTYAEMFVIEGGGYIIDTPGIKEFGILDLEAEEVGHYFKEFKPWLGKCRFHNCLHREEPGCVVKEAVSQHRIAEERYINYLQIVKDAESTPRYLKI